MQEKAIVHICISGLFFIFSKKMWNKVTLNEKKSNKSAGEFNQKSKYWSIIEHSKKCLFSKKNNKKNLLAIQKGNTQPLCLRSSHTVYGISSVYPHVASDPYFFMVDRPTGGFQNYFQIDLSELFSLASVLYIWAQFSWWRESARNDSTASFVSDTQNQFSSEFWHFSYNQPQFQVIALISSNITPCNQ